MCRGQTELLHLQLSYLFENHIGDIYFFFKNEYTFMCMAFSGNLDKSGSTTRLSYRPL